MSKNIEKHAGDWHPDFDLESVEDITPAALPTDDNAKILDTASSKSIATSSSSPSVSSSSPIVHTVPLRNDEKDSAAGPTEVSFLFIIYPHSLCLILTHL